MTGPAVSTHVGVVESESRRLRSLEIQVFEAFSMIRMTRVTYPFDDALEATKESAALSDPLARVARQVSDQEKRAHPGNASASFDALTASLTLSDDQSYDLLDKLRSGGAALRGRLTEQCEKALKANAFLGARGEEPALTVMEDDKSPHVLWDLMYDGGMVGDVDWESFWGFRVPIAHWLYVSRTEQLRLRSPFGAIHEELPFAALEIDGVAQRMQCREPASLTAHFRRLVTAALATTQMSTAEIDAWLADHETNWLEEFLAVGPAKPLRPKQWKRDSLVQMLRDNTCDLIHFACHSAPSNGIAAQAEMTMKIGGENLTLNVGEMRDLRMPIAAENAPGPLVFLNACRSVTGQQPFQPPPFATAWIDHCGALAVISAICPVPDFFAHAFALKYYDYLFGRADATFAGEPVKGSLAGALLATRRYFMETHRNPLGLAYILYTSPRAHVAGTVGSAP